MHDTVDIGHFLTSGFSEPYLYAVNRQDFLRTGSEVRFREQFGEALFEKNTCYVICGSDSGLLIRYITNRGLPPGSRYLFVEPEPVAELVRDAYAEELSHEHLALAGPADWEARLDALGVEPYTYLDRVRIYKSLAAAAAYLDGYLPLWREVRSRTKYRIWNARTKSSLHLHISRQLENLADNQIPSLFLRDLAPGRTAVVVGGGPSLDELLPWIRRHREHVVLLAVSRMSRALRDAGLTPDIVVAIDPFDDSYTISKEMLSMDGGTLFVNGYHVSPQVLSAWGGPKTFIGPLYPWSTPNAPESIAQYGPTVTNAAAWIAVEMGCAQVVLAGVDLCYSQNGFTHASGTDEHAAGPALMEGDMLVETNSGLLAETRNEFAQAGRMIDVIAERGLERGCVFINPAPNATRLEHVEHRPTDAIDIAPATDSIGSLIRHAMPAADRDDRLRHCRAVEQEVQGMLHAVRAVRTLAKEALQCNRRLFGRDGRPPSFAHKHKMDRIEDKLNTRHAVASRFMKQFGLRHFITTVRPNEDVEWTDEELEAYGQAYYGAYVATAQDLEPVLERTLALVQLRIREEDTPADIPGLLADWRRLDQLVRGQAWCALHPDQAAAATAADRAGFQALEETLEARERDNAAIHAQYASDITSLQGLPGRAAEYFTLQQRDGLERLARGLAMHADRPEAERLGALVEGHLLELDGRREAAETAYGRVGPGPGHEEAQLRRLVLQLELGRVPDALELLHTLTGLSAFYLPYYADLQRISGDSQGALDSYTAYLKQAPDDLMTMMKMGLLYHELGVDEATRWVMEHVLSRDPRNGAARQVLAELDARQASA